VAQPASLPLPLRQPGIAPWPAPNNLPAQLTSFVGREHDRAEIGRLLREQSRLVTLTGAGGVGKTRLALEVASDLVCDFSEGVWLIELAPVFDSRRVLSTIATTLGVHEEHGRDLAEALCSALRFRPVLLVLDNCEHVVDACAEFTHRLLSRSPHVVILASSRESLNVPGETIWRVPSLPVPTSVQLFVDRAAARAPALMRGETANATIAQICERLDGIPLALELAAARVPALGLEQIASRLDDRFRLLVGGSRTAPPRQQTLRAVVDWSYELLSDDERALFERLAVFAGGWGLEAAEAICEADVDVLARLVSKSLVGVEQGPAGTGYRMLETMRAYAAAKLVASGAESALRDRHLEWYRALTETAERVARRAPDVSWAERTRHMLRLRHDIDNLRAACRWSLSGGDLETGLRTAIALFPFFYSQGFLREGREWLAALLEDAHGRVATDVYGAALSAASKLAAHHGDDDAAARYAPLFEKLPAEARTPQTTADVNSGQSISALRRGNTRESRAHAERAIDLSRQTGDRVNAAMCLNYLGAAVFQEGALHEARAVYQQALDEALAVDFQLGAALARDGLANVARARGEPASARRMYEDALAIFRDMGGTLQAAQSQIGLGYATLDERDFVRAAREFSEAAEMLAAVGHDQLLALALDGLATARRELHSTPHSASAAVAMPLTAREVEVVRLLGQGLTNRQIANELVISVRTADRHVENILSKLGLRSRGAVGAWAAQQGLLVNG
jgi:predicted ATPase/DNA-binding CsgD family transcriptional regulator